MIAEPRGSHQAILLEIALLMNERRSVEEVFTAFAERLLATAQFDFTAIVSAEPDPRFLRMLGHHPLWPDSLRPGTVVDARTAPEAWRKAGLHGIEFMPAESDPPLQARHFNRGFRQGWVAALVVGESFGGFLTVARHQPRPLTQDQLDFLRAAARLLAGALHQDRLIEDAEREAAQSDLLNDLAVLLHAGEPVEALFDRMLILIEKAIQLDHISLAIRSDGKYRLVGARPELGLAVGSEYLGEAAQDDAVFAAPENLLEYRSDRNEGFWPELYRAAGIVRIVSAGLSLDGERLGMVSMGRASNFAFSDSDRRFISRLAVTLSQAEANLRRIRRIEAAAAREQVLNELAVLLNAGEPVDSLMDRLPVLLERALEFDYVGLVVPTEHPGLVRMVGSRPQLVWPAGTMLTLDEAAITPVRDQAGVIQFRTDHAKDSPPLARLRESGIRRLAIVILRDGDGAPGMFVLGRERNRPYSAEDVEFLEVVSTLLGQAMANQLRVQRAEANAARGRALNELTVLLNAGEPVDTLFDRLLALLEQAIEFDYVGLLVAADDPGLLRMVGSRPELVRPVGSTIDFETSGLAAVSQSPGLVQFRADRVVVLAADALRAAGVMRVAAVALRDGQEPIGLFSLARRRNLPYPPQDVEFIEVLATILGQAVANQRRLQRAQAEAARSQLLNEVAVLVNAGQPPQNFFDRLTALLQEAIQFDNMAMLLPEGDGSQLRVVGSLHSRVLKAGDVFPAERYFDGRPATDGRLVHQVNTSELASETGRRAAASGMVWVATAILREGEDLLGVFSLSRDSDTQFSRSDLELLELLATLLGQALANDRRLRQSRAEAARSQLLSELAVMLNAGEPTEVVFSTVVGLLKPIVDWDRTSLMLVERDGKVMQVVAAIPGATMPVGYEIPLGDFPLSADEMVALPSLRYRLADMPIEVVSRIAESGGTSAIAAALRQRGELLGLFNIARDSEAPIADEEARMVEFVATLLAQSVAGERRIKRTLAEAARSRLLNELSLLLNAGEPVEAMFDLLPPLLSSAVAFHYVGVAFEAGRQDYVRAVDWNSRFPGPAVPTWVPRTSLGIETIQNAGRNIAQTQFPDDAQPGLLSEEFAKAGLKRSVVATLGSAERPLGVLHVGRAHDEPFTADDLAFLEVVAAIFSQAITNQARVTSAAAEAEEQRIIAAVASAVAAETDPGALVGAIVQPLRALIPRPFVAFGYIDGDELVYPAPNRTIRMLLEPYTRMAIKLGQIHSPDLPDDLTPLSPLWEFGVKANATTLARSGGVPAGILVTGSREDGYSFGERELRIFRLIAQIVGPAMENVRSAERARQEAAEQRILAEVAAIAAAEKDPYDILQGLVAPLGHLVADPFAAYGWFDRDEIVYLAANGEERRQPVSPVQALARDEGQALSHGDQLGPGHVAHDYGLRALSYIAIRSGGAVTGLLCVASRENAYVFGERELRLLGEVARIVGPAIEARLAERNVARQSALYSLILRSLREGVVLLDAENRSVFENSFGRKVLTAVDPGRRSNSVARLADLLSPIAREQFLEAVREGKPTQGRAALTVDSEKRWVDYELVALDDPRFRLLFVTSDVTDAVHREAERAQLEQASRLAALGELIGGVAHELNNPLTAILGFAEIIGLSPAASQLSEEVAIIQKEAVRARNIVRDLLFIARPAPVEQREVAVHEVVAHIERLRKAAWAQQGVQVTLDVPPGDCLVWGNEHQLTQVLLNLITNAEHAVEGRLTRTIRIAARRKDEEVEIVVADSGAGMSAEVAERVFEPFFTTKQGSGTGLGLSLSYSIVQSHHGRIEVESVLGAGTHFRVILPALVAPPPEPASDPEPVATRPARVLVVDDEPSLRKVCQRLVTSMGHDCEVAESSATAREIAAQQDFDLVLCDYRLASETAADVMEAFQSVAPHLIERTVIATGATTDAGVVDVTARYGLKLIGKPYGADELGAIIAEAQRRLFASPA